LSYRRLGTFYGKIPRKGVMGRSKSQGFDVREIPPSRKERARIGHRAVPTLSRRKAKGAAPVESLGPFFLEIGKSV